jgi:hypothetical protein
MSTPDNKTESKDESQAENIIEKPESTDTAIKKPSVPLWVNLTIYISTIFFPIIGIVMGFTYLRKEDPEMKRSGRNWLVLGVVILLLNIFVVSMIKRPDTGL